MGNFFADLSRFQERDDSKPSLGLREPGVSQVDDKNAEQLVLSLMKSRIYWGHFQTDRHYWPGGGAVVVDDRAPSSGRQICETHASPSGCESRIRRRGAACGTHSLKQNFGRQELRHQGEQNANRPALVLPSHSSQRWFLTVCFRGGQREGEACPPGAWIWALNLTHCSPALPTHPDSLLALR